MSSQIKSVATLGVVALLAGSFAAPTHAQEISPMHHQIVVTPQEIVDTPISPLLFSHFVELGYGVQTEPMLAEMLWNRSLEPFTPYREISLVWFDLYNDRNDKSKGFETDWRVFDWYHSGYRHDAWFAAPAPLPGYLPMDDDTTCLVEHSPDHDIHLEPIDGGAAHGRWMMRIVNNSDMYGGLAQEGKYLRPDTTLEFGGWFRSDSVNLSSAKVALFKPGEWENPIAEATIHGIGPSIQRYEATLETEDFEGWAVFAIMIQPGSALTVDALSLRPSDHIGGWRRDVIEATRRMNPSVYRFPGGCFASFYDWREGIGPRDQRVPQPSYFWGGMSDNEVGIAEMVTFARETGGEVMYCLNLHHPLKRHWDYHLSEEIRGLHGYDLPQFSDIAQGAREAAALVAYCNAPVSHPMGALRASHGFPEPFNVKYWEIDNETHRWMHGVEYAHAALQYAKAMKAVDPTIKIGVISYTDDYLENLSQILEIGTGWFDFIADRSYGWWQVSSRIDILREHNQKHGDSIFYTNTEWLAYEFEPDAYNRIELEGESTTPSFMFSKWRYALNVARNYLMFGRAGGELRFTNFSNFANTHAQSVIETPREGVFLTAAGRIFELYTQTGAAWPLETEGHTFDATREFVVHSAWNLERDTLILHIVNMSDDTHATEFDLSPLGRAFSTIKTMGLVADGPLAMNTMENPDGIRDSSASATLSGSHAKVQVEPWSVIVLMIN